MTIALCLNCGKMKRGAFCSCFECGTTTCGNQDVDLVFTDHFFSVKNLKILGEDLRQLYQFESDNEMVLQAFILHAAQYFPKEYFNIIDDGIIDKSVINLLDRANLKKHDLSNLKIAVVSHKRGVKFLLLLVILLLAFFIGGLIIYIIVLIVDVDFVKLYHSYWDFAVYGVFFSSMFGWKVWYDIKNK